jgi:hypothetical protein
VASPDLVQQLAGTGEPITVSRDGAQVALAPLTDIHNNPVKYEYDSATFLSELLVRQMLIGSVLRKMNRIKDIKVVMTKAGGESIAGSAEVYFIIVFFP